jgi:hypothetical protein
VCGSSSGARNAASGRRRKAAPKDAFLGLCEAEIIIGIPGGRYTRSVLNKGYALKSVDILKTNPKRSDNEDALWQAVQSANSKVHNSQMDVVATLWKLDLIKH